jgi:hypothetical protein
MLHFYLEGKINEIGQKAKKYFLSKGSKNTEMRPIQLNNLFYSRNIQSDDIS